MRWQHRRAVGCQIAACEAAERVRHFGHASEAAHHLVEQLAQRRPRRFRQVGVNRRRGDVLVAEKRLDDAGVDLVLEEPGRIGVTQRVWRRAATAGEIGRPDGLGKGAGQDMGGDGTGSPAVGEEPARIAVVSRRPHPPQAFVHRLGHRHDPFFVALADDAQDPAGLIDGGNGKSGGLADPQAAAVNQAETASVYGIADRGENALRFGVRKRLRQPPLLGKPDLFLNSAQSKPSVFR